jgi:hypothetical protein
LSQGASSKSPYAFAATGGVHLVTELKIDSLQATIGHKLRSTLTCLHHETSRTDSGSRRILL